MVTQGSTNQIIPENDFTVQRTVLSSGTDVVLEVQQTDTTNTNSSAKIEAKTLTGGGDAYVSSLHQANQWTWGQSFATSTLQESFNGSPSVGTNVRRMTTTGAQTMPLQPLFLAYKESITANASGNGTFVQPVIFDTTIRDQSGNYNNATGTFTAPVDGNYWFYHVIAAFNISAAHTSGTSFFEVNGVTRYVSYSVNAATCRELDNTSLNWFGQEIIHMTAGDTIVCGWVVFNGTKTITLAGNAPPLITTRFGGYLIC